MNRIYRLVWNQSLGCYVVASELARSRSKSSLSGAVKPLALLSMLVSFGMTWPSMSIADVISANTATQVYDSPNGVPIVDIAAANANGLSHNKFNQYNVDSKGLVLNNNANAGFTAVQSQLAGQVQVNPNLNNAASVILNEVVSANRSTLAGYTEVAGTRADVIVANPWGITCSGCGFINTDRVTLSTGTPIFNNGNLTGFDVTQGDVLINGSGADLSAQKMFDIVARSIKLEGQINADDLMLVAGSNEWNYASRTATATTPTGTTPAYAIDSTMLGGMYAGSVQLLATEAGVGVRMLGDAAASTGSFTLTADGKIELNNQVSAQQNIELTSTANSADTISLTDTSLTANKNIELTANNGGATITGGVFKATDTLSYQVASLDDSETATIIDDNNKRYANTVDINTTAAASIDGVSYGAASSLDITAHSLDLGAGSTALYTDNGDILIRTNDGLNNAGAISAKAGKLSVYTTGSTAGDLTNSGTLYGKTYIDFGAGASPINAINNSGTILSDGGLEVTAASLDNTGTIQGTDFTYIGVTSLTNDGVLIASNTLGESGIIIADSLTNGTQGIVQSGGNLSFNIGDQINNANKLLAAGNLTITGTGSAPGFTNVEGETVFIQSGAALSISGFDSLDVTAGSTLLGDSLQLDVDNLTINGTVQARSGDSSISSDILINNAYLQSDGNLALNIGTSLNNYHSIVSSAGNVTIRGTDADYALNNAGTLEATTGLMDIKGQSQGKGVSVTNSSVIKGDTLQITADALTLESGAQIESTGVMQLDVNTLSMPQSDSIILAGGSSTLDVSQSLDTAGKIHSTDQLLINALNTVNGLNVSIQATGAISAINYLKVNSNNFYNWGTIYTGGNFDAYDNDSFINYATGEINAGGKIDIVTGSQFTNNNKIVATGDITISGHRFNNEIAGGDTREWVAENFQYTDTGWPSPDLGVDPYAVDPGVFAPNQVRNYTKTWVEKQQYAGLVPTDTDRPQITSTSGDIFIDSFITGLNLAGIISARDITLTPSNSPSASFTNDDYSLRQDSKLETWYDEILWDGLTQYRFSYATNPTAERYGGISTSATTYTPAVTSSGLYASRTFSGGGFSLVNAGALGAPNSVEETSGPSGAGLASTVNTSTTTGSSALTFGGLNLTLPTSPNGLFIVSLDPSSGYLVETNPLYQVGSGFGGSDYLLERYGYDPELIQKRLGDASYEAYLIRQQLIAQTGNNLLDGYQQEEVLLQNLMEQGADEADRLGFVWGESPTEEQLANLDSDIVWMVEVSVNGEKVLAPRVYLSQATKNKILTGVVIAAATIDLDVESLSNSGGTIVAKNGLTVTSVNDITNTSGTIKGGDVSLTSTEGSIVNETWSETTGGIGNTATNIGKTGSIESTGNLSLTADQDIRIIGANLSAEGDASLSAGNDIVVDTIVDKSSTRTSNHGDGTSDATTTTTETNIGSTLDIGGNLILDSGNDTTIAGSNVSVDGDLDVTTGGDFNVIARQDKVTTKTKESESGMGVGGGVFGSETTTTDKFSGTNSGSTLSVGGNALVDSEGSFVVQGSDVDVAGNADIDAAGGIQILDGLDVETTTSVTETFTLLKVEGDTESGSASDSSSSTEYLAADAGASANASAESNHDLVLEERTTTTTNSGSNTSVASNLNIGGNLKATTKGDLTLQGSNIDVGGNATLDAENVNVLTGRNETWSDTETTRTTVGIFEESQASTNAGADAEAQAYGAGATNASADASANASAGTDVTIGVRVEQETSSDYSLTNTGSSISTGGDLSITAKDTATFVGADVASGGDMSIDATDINNLAARDITESSTSSNSDTVGLYVSGDASAQASAESNAQTGAVTNADGSLSASAEAEAGAGVRYNNKTSSTTDGTSTVLGNTFKSGGDFSRTAADTIVDQATEVDAGGDIDQSARVIRDEAVHDETYSTSETSEDDARIGVYAGAKVDAGADAGGLSGGSADAGAEASAGVQAQYENENTSSSSETKTAVTSKFKSGGNINSSSEESTTLVGTQFESDGDVNIEAGSLDYQAAQDSTSSTNSSSEVSVDGKVAIYGSAGVKLDVDTADGGSSESTTTARAGSISAGGNLNIKTKGDATFVGTNLEAGNEASIDAGGDVDFQAARNTTTSSSDSTNANVALSATKKDDSMGVGGGYEESNSESSTAVVGSIKSGKGGTSIKSGGDSSFEGTQLISDGATSIEAGGDVNLKAAINTSSEDSAGASADIGMGAEGSPEGVVEGGFTDVGSTESTTTSIQSGGDISIKGGTINSQEADIQSTTGTKTMIGEVVNTEAENSEHATGFEVRLKGGGGDSSKKKAGTDSSSTRPLSNTVSDSKPKPVSPSKDAVTPSSETTPVKESSADSPNPNESGSGDSTAEESANPNPNESGSEDNTSDETANPNPNESGSEDNTSDETANPNPNKSGAEETKPDETADPNPNESGAEETKSDETADPNPNESGAEETKSDETADPNPNESVSEDTKSDETVNPNLNESGAEETKSDETADPNSNETGAEESKSDETANPNPNESGSEDNTSDETANPNPNESGSEDNTSDETANPNPNELGAEETKSDETADPNPNESGAEETKSDETADPNPNESVSEDTKSDETANPNPNESGSGDSTAEESVNTNSNETGAEESKSDETANPNPNESGAEETKSDETSDPNPNESGAEETKSDETSDPNPNESGSEKTKSDETADPNPNESGIEDNTSDETANPNPNESGSEDNTSDETVNPNPNESGSEDNTSDETANPNPNESGAEETKSDETADPNSNETGAEESKSDETANPNPNESGSGDSTAEESVNTNSNETGAEESKSDETANPNPNESGAEETKSDETADPNPNESGLEDNTSDETANPNPNESGSEETKSDETADPNPNESGSGDSTAEESVNPNSNETGAEESKSDETANPNPNESGSEDNTSDETANPNPNESGSEDNTSDETADPSPNESGAEETKSDETADPNPNESVSEDNTSDETANPNPNESGSEETKSDQTADPNLNDLSSEDNNTDDAVIDETNTTDDENHALRALNRVKKTIPAVVACVDQTLDNGQIECVPVE